MTPSFREKRVSPRRNAAIDAWILYDGRRRGVECVIRDLSEGGAKLQVAVVMGLPNSFELVIPGHPPNNCRVVWRAFKELGVQFVD